MQPLNTIPIENFINKARIAAKSNQKNLTLTIDEASQLMESITMVMTRLLGKLDEAAQKTPTEEVITLNMDGGGLR
jgi:hypothetical protein